MTLFFTRAPRKWWSTSPKPCGKRLEATILLYSPGIAPFLEDLARGVDRVFYFEEGPRDPPRCQSRQSRR
ncbi:MAG: hypothetical protein LUQ22_06835 [Methanotrichaceae archaeon]|nr:hypothetical protein [Methanotrichaceae archaeon]